MGDRLPEGVYSIASYPSGIELRSYNPQGAIHAESRKPIVPYGYWRLISGAENGYTIVNEGLHANVTASPTLDAKVVVDNQGVAGTTFAINHAGGDEFTVKLLHDDLEWAMVAIKEPDLPADFAQVRLQRSGGTTEHFTFRRLHA